MGEAGENGGPRSERDEAMKAFKPRAETARLKEEPYDLIKAAAFARADRLRRARRIGIDQKRTSHEASSPDTTPDTRHENRTNRRQTRNEIRKIHAGKNKEKNFVKGPDRPIELHEAPPPVTINLDEVIEALIKKHGTTPEAIKRSLKEANAKDAYKDVVLMLNAQILDLKLRDDNFQTDKKTKQLIAEIETGYKALFVDRKNRAVHKDPQTGARTVNVTPSVDQDGQITADIGHKPGELSYSLNLARITDAAMFTGKFKKTIEDLKRARKAAKSQAEGKPLRTDPKLYGTSDADPRVEVLNDYLHYMIGHFDEAEDELNDPEAIARVKSKHQLDDEQIAQMRNSNKLLLALFEGIQNKKLKWRKMKKTPKA